MLKYAYSRKPCRSEESLGEIPIESQRNVTSENKTPIKSKKFFQSLMGFVYTLWLFTVSDHKTFVFPETMFGIFGAISGPLMTTNPQPNIRQILLRAPIVIAWTWLNTLVFVLANQRLPESITEDKMNKPFRPLAAGRISMAQTRRLLLLGIPLVLVLTYCFLGSYEETVVLFCLTWMYNDLGGSDEDFVTRNLIIGVAYIFYGNGALRVASSLNNGKEHTLNRNGYIWSGMIGAVILTTMQVQDLKDVEGDRSRNRHTAPLAIGDLRARWTIAVPVVLWSLICPIFWGLEARFIAAVVVFGLVVAFRVFYWREKAADRATWKLWSYWLAVLYALPVLKHYF